MRKNRTRHWLLFVFLSLLFTHAAASQSPGEQEREFLRAAASGDIQNVFLARLFNGYVAFPRTSIVLATFTPPSTMVELKLNGFKPGIAYIGAYSLVDGRKQTIPARQPLPSGPARTERRGTLTIEYFDRPYNSVLVYDDRYYVLLTGSATILTNELVQASVSLSGPPNVFSAKWRALSKWADLPAWGSAEAEHDAGEPEDPVSCAARIVSTGALGNAGGGWVISNPHPPGSKENHFETLGLLSSDRVVAIDGRAILTPDDWLHAVLSAAKGNAVGVTVQRGTRTQVVKLNASAANSLLASCLAQ